MKKNGKVGNIRGESNGEHVGRGEGKFKMYPAQDLCGRKKVKINNQISDTFCPP